ncbi:uncharacterized protein FOMMEDRAFT_107364 [Fomitiporia mediterranea MF3/22]|uniref:uncharacterized protein n=1 Tax=Fomitiporia mediterranea (strain MF3/22) TaxID=694068 RepID=UPI0004407350|nr:uncharacterized protein FOMMEDRAFT_107364 [Fomitiporia mediterranea MF3/22]EJD04567.1 hypothetical protein FOMMEDRAFT_107364 [Fomitiporia mediterranea MF3/22]
MGRFFDSCPPNLLEWIQNQHIFWVATAPLSPNGHVNVSPKGAFDCFHVIGPNKVWYEDLTGSGSETIAHLRENKRITVMFCAFDGPPRIVRLFGTGTVHEFGTPEYEVLVPRQKRKPGSRSAIVVDVHKVGSSCGYSIPFFDFKKERTLLLERMSKREAGAVYTTLDPATDKGLREYWSANNVKSIDGLPSLISAPNAENTPSNSWALEDENERSNKKVLTYQRQEHVTGFRNSNISNKALVHQLVAAFASGVFTTLLLVRISRLITW